MAVYEDELGKNNEIIASWILSFNTRHLFIYLFIYCRLYNAVFYRDLKWNASHTWLDGLQSNYYIAYQFAFEKTIILL